jgi:hypothetical protein
MNCLFCGGPRDEPGTRSLPTRRYCRTCTRFDGPLISTQSNSSAAVSSAIRRGDLMPATQYFCVDCGGSASQYDHRDYTKPLDVDPVCRSCNARRGPAHTFPAQARAARLARSESHI